MLRDAMKLVVTEYMQAVKDLKPVTVESIKPFVDDVFKKFEIHTTPKITIVDNPRDYILNDKYDSDIIISNLDKIDHDQPLIEKTPWMNMEAIYRPFTRLKLALRHTNKDGVLYNGHGLLGYEWPLLRTYLEKSKQISHVILLSDKAKSMIAFNKQVIHAQINEKNVVILQTPKMRFDDQDRFHATNAPAIEWADQKLHYIHGVIFNDSLWKAISERTMDVMEVLNIKNIEQRYMAVEHYGAEKLLSNAKMIDKSTRGNELYELQEPNTHRTLSLLKYQCPSTGRIYTSFVPAYMHSADRAMAWKFNIGVTDYESLKTEA